MKLKVFLLFCLYFQANNSYSQLKENSYQFPEKFSKSYFFWPCWFLPKKSKTMN